MVMAAMARITGRHATALGSCARVLPRMLTGPVVMTCGLMSQAASGLTLRPWHVVGLYALSEALTVAIQNRLLRADFAPLPGFRAMPRAGADGSGWGCGWRPAR